MLCGGTTGTAHVKAGKVDRLEGLTEFLVEFEHVATASIPGRGAYVLTVKSEFPSGTYRLSLKKTRRGDGIPAAWHEEPWFEFFMRVLESQGGCTAQW